MGADTKEKPVIRQAGCAAESSVATGQDISYDHAAITREFEEALRRTDYLAAEQVIGKAFDAAATLQSDAIHADALFLRGQLSIQQAQTPEAIEALRECLQLREQIGDPRGIALAHRMLGTAYLRSSDFAAAGEHMHAAIWQFETLGDTKGLAGALNNASNYYKAIGDIALSLEMLHRSLPLMEEAGDTLNAAKILFNITNTYTILNRPGEGIPFAERALPMIEATGDVYMLAVALNILGTAFAAWKKPDEALNAFERCRNLCEERGFSWIHAVVLYDIGQIQLEARRFPEAKEALLRARTLNETGTDRMAICESLLRLGMLYAHPEFDERDETAALQHMLEARRIAEELDVPKQLGDVYEALTDLYERTGDYREALACHRLLYDVRRRLFNQESDQRIREIEARTSVERAQKDAEIAHLRTVALAEALQEAERMRALADERARTDALTGLANRRALDERFDVEIERVRRYCRPLSVALVDIDFFKSINDDFGHGAGDAVLRAVARVLRDGCRATEIAARYGGEEFALLLPETDIEQAGALCERLRTQIEALTWDEISPNLHVTVSIGIAEATEGTAFDAEDGEQDDAKRILSRADANLYVAKRSGRNWVVA